MCRSGANFQAALIGPFFAPTRRRQLPQLLAARVHVVRREPVAGAVEVDAAPAELVGVVDQLAAAPCSRSVAMRLRRAADVGVHGLPLGRPRDVVLARAAHRPDRRRHAVLEHQHVARDAALGRGLPDDRGVVEAALRPGVAVVVDHHRDRVPARRPPAPPCDRSAARRTSSGVGLRGRRRRGRRCRGRRRLGGRRRAGCRCRTRRQRREGLARVGVRDRVRTRADRAGRERAEPDPGHAGERQRPEDDRSARA